MFCFPHWWHDVTCRAPLSLVIYAVLLLVPGSPARGADEVGDILRQIKAENTGSAALKPAPESSKPKPRPQLPSTKKKSQPQPSSAQPQQQTFSGPIWGPKDKLPKQFVGHGLAGDFVIVGHFEGCVMLEAAADRGNIFCRTFVISNASIDLPEFHILPIDDRRPLTIPRSKPLIFERKSSLAYYHVRMQ
jgi:hypothetical protein